MLSETQGLVQTLRQLKIFYEQQSKETYNSNMSLILFRVLYEAGKKLSADPEWFADYYEEICSLLLTLHASYTKVLF